MRRGQITVFLALILSTLCSLLIIIVESTRVATLRMQTEVGMNIGMNSIFAEYNREMLNRYDLFYIDSTYGNEVAQINNIEEHLQRYLEANWIDWKKITETEKGDWFRIKIENVKTEAYLLASDLNGKVIQRQAVNYMKNYSHERKTFDAKQICNLIESIKICESDYFEERNNILKGLASLDVLDEVNAIQSNEILDIVMSGASPSEKSVIENTLSSHRTLSIGNGSTTFNETIKGNESERLFEKYIYNKCSNLRDIREKSVLDYEIEYILYGKSNDKNNLSILATELLKIRESANMTFLMKNSNKKEEARELAVMLAGITASQEAIELYTKAIIYTWGYAEAAIDVNRLLIGGRVPVMKEEQDWILPIKDLSMFRRYMGDAGGQGINYEDYLVYFLYKQSDEIERARLMDIIEQNIRFTEENEAFRIDGCVEYIKAKVDLKSDYGYQYNITRDYGYEK